MEGVDPTTMRVGAPTVRIDALDMSVELLSRVEDDASSDAFYSRLCEATCALTSMDRAVIFRYDEVRRRVRAAGAYGIGLDAFADAHVTVESAPVARQSLEEDRVIEVTGDLADEVPEEFRDLLRESNLVCTPLAAAGRWFGVILSDSSKPGPLSEEERYLLWTLGKTAALATLARVATTAGARARQLQERIDLARDVHESVIQRLFAVQLVFSSSAAHKHARPTKVEVSLERDDDNLVLEVCNDGVSGRPRTTGMGLKLAALEALQAGGIVEFGVREPGTCRVRLAVPVDHA